MSSGISNETIHDALQRAKQLAAVNSTGQKRPLNDDLNFHLAKRPSGGLPSNMAGMAMGGPVSGDAVTETMDIPNNSVGLVIGRGGEQITNIQQQAACRVQMASDVNTAGCRTVTLQGPKHCIDMN